VIFLFLVAVLTGCSSSPSLPHVSSVRGAHVRATWEEELPGARAEQIHAPRGRVAALTTAARRARAQLVVVRFYRASSGRAAPAVVLAVSDPAPFLKHRLRAFLTRLQQINGVYGDDYVGVVDANGRFVWENGRAHLPGTFAGSLWIRRDLDSCSPVVHSQPALAEPPPQCAAG